EIFFFKARDEVPFVGANSAVNVYHLIFDVQRLLRHASLFPYTTLFRSATRRTLFHVLVGCGLLMLKVSRLKLPVIWLTFSINRPDRKSGSAGMPRPISYAVLCLKKKSRRGWSR